MKDLKALAEGMTEGPWCVVADDWVARVITGRTDHINDGYMPASYTPIAEIGQDHQEDLADAHLISMLPELVEEVLGLREERARAWDKGFKVGYEQANDENLSDSGQIDSVMNPFREDGS